MVWLRRGYQLRVLLFGRPVRLFHLALTLWSGAVGVALLFVGADTDHPIYPLDYILGMTGIGAAVMLTVGWLWSKHPAVSSAFVDIGLSLAMALGLTRGFFVVVTDSSRLVLYPWLTGIGSFAWFLVALGSWLIQKADDYHLSEVVGE